jgi:hypothetical protein
MFLERGAKVAGVDNDAASVSEAQSVGVSARCADLDLVALSEIFPDDRFEVVVFADVLEHLKNPDAVLLDSRSLLAPGGRVLASIPNVAHGNVRLNLLLGRFDYATLGLLDATHLRFFTGDTIGQLFSDAGFRIEAMRRVTSPVDSALIEAAVEALSLPIGAEGLLEVLSAESAETFQYVVAASMAETPGRSSPVSFWTLGDGERPGPASPRYLCVDEVPNAVADMRSVMRGLEISLGQTQAYLDSVIHDKDELITGLEAGLAETRAYLDAVIRDKDELIGGLERSLTEDRAEFESVIRGRDEVVAVLENDLGEARQSIASLEQQFLVERQRYQLLVLPTVSVVVVNWNGEALLPACLSSLQQQRYPEERYRIVVVDNASADGSTSLIRRHFPGVTLMEAGANLGFAGGNNLAIEASDSDYVALLNNDAVADPDWLMRLVEVAESDPTIAAVNAKILLMIDRLVITVEVDGTFVPGPHDPRRLGAQVAQVAALGERMVPLEFIRGAFGAEQGEVDTYRWITDRAELRVPIEGPVPDTVMIRLLPSVFPSGAQPTIRFRVSGEVVAEQRVPADGHIDVPIPFTPKDVRPVIQNAGSVVLPDGAGSDRGSVVVGGEPFYDVDRGQYDLVEDVPAFCGAATLLRRSALEEVGTFDSSFFMYYEDTDLSLRLRRHGWRIVYAPDARVRHHHSATSVEWSPRFCYYTERNRLLTLMRNGRVSDSVREWARYTGRLFRPGETAENRKRFFLVQRSLLFRLPKIVSDRRRRRGEPAPETRIVFRAPLPPSSGGGP